MTFEDIVQRILSTRPDLTQKELLERIEKKKKESQEFFTDEAAARLIALELGVEIPRKPFQLKVQIGDLVSGLSDVTVTGRIIVAYPSKTFTRQDQTEGKVAHLVIADKSGSLRVVLWDERTELVDDEKVKPEQMIRVLHGYVRKGRDGKLELHVGSRGRLQISLPDNKEAVMPLRFAKIENLKPNMRHLDVLARVEQVGDIREFKRSRTDVGHVSTLLIRDETGYASLNLWEDKAHASKQTESGDIVLVQGAYTREQFGKVDLNIGAQGTLTVNPKVAEVEALESLKEKVPKISEIIEEGGPITVKGIVATTPAFKEVITSKGEKIGVASFDLKDDTGGIQVSLWRRLAETVKDLSVGTEIRIKNAYVRRGFGNQLEITSRMFTSVEKSPKTETDTQGEVEQLLS